MGVVWVHKGTILVSFEATNVPPKVVSDGKIIVKENGKAFVDRKIFEKASSKVVKRVSGDSETIVNKDGKQKETVFPISTGTENVFRGVEKNGFLRTSVFWRSTPTLINTKVTV